MNHENGRLQIHVSIHKLRHENGILLSCIPSLSNLWVAMNLYLMIKNEKISEESKQVYLIFYR